MIYRRAGNSSGCSGSSSGGGSGSSGGRLSVVVVVVVVVSAGDKRGSEGVASDGAFLKAGLRSFSRGALGVEISGVLAWC